MAEDITEQEILDEVPENEVPQEERPEHIPEKFWKDGTVDYNEMIMQKTYQKPMKYLLYLKVLLKKMFKLILYLHGGMTQLKKTV